MGQFREFDRRSVDETRDWFIWCGAAGKHRFMDDACALAIECHFIAKSTINICTGPIWKTWMQLNDSMKFSHPVKIIQIGSGVHHA